MTTPLETDGAATQKRRRHAFVPRLALGVTGLLVTLLVTEVVLRVFGYAGDSERGAVVFDTDFGDVPSSSWIFGLDKSSPEPGNGVLEINGEAVPIQKAAGEARVVFVGDSGTVGAGVGFTNSYPILIRQELDRKLPGRRVRVINAGEIGLTSVNELQLLQAHLRRLKPDIVVVGLFMANDINFNLRHEADLFGDRKRISARRRAFRWLRQHSSLVHFATLRFLALNEGHRWVKAKEPRDQGSSCMLTAMDDAGFDFLNYKTGELALYRKHPSAVAEHCFDLMGRVLHLYSALAKQEGFRLAVAMIPTSSTLSGKVNMYCYPDAGETLQRLGVQEADMDFDLPARRIAALCRQYQVPCFDPTPMMRELGPQEVILPRDDHLNRKGHRILADMLADPIASWLQGADR